MGITGERGGDPVKVGVVAERALPVAVSKPTLLTIRQ